jgi:hypothetical protein
MMDLTGGKLRLMFTVYCSKHNNFWYTTVNSSNKYSGTNNGGGTEVTFDPQIVFHCKRLYYANANLLQENTSLCYKL